MQPVRRKPAPPESWSLPQLSVGRQVVALLGLEQWSAGLAGGRVAEGGEGVSDVREEVVGNVQPMPTTIFCRLWPANPQPAGKAAPPRPKSRTPAASDGWAFSRRNQQTRKRQEDHSHTDPQQKLHRGDLSTEDTVSANRTRIFLMSKCDADAIRRL